MRWLGGVFKYIDIERDFITRERREELPPLGRSAEPNAHPRITRREGRGGVEGPTGGGRAASPRGAEAAAVPAAAVSPVAPQVPGSAAARGCRGGWDPIRSSRRFAPFHPRRRGKAAFFSPLPASFFPLPIHRSFFFWGLLGGGRCSGGCGSGCGPGAEELGEGGGGAIIPGPPGGGG